MTCADDNAAARNSLCQIRRKFGGASGDMGWAIGWVIIKPPWIKPFELSPVPRLTDESNRDQ
jgi:hypothetical protein